MPRTLVTHLIPHLDDVTALWLLRRYDPASKRSGLKFVPTAAEGVKLAKGEIGVGVGRGKYDEHKGDRKDSATSLVWKDLKKRGKTPKGLKGDALAELVDYVRRGDLGEFIGRGGETFALSPILRAMAELPGEDSESATLVGFRILDAMLVLYEERTAVDRAIDKGVKFRTKWGTGVGVEVEAIPGSVSNRVAERGYALVVLRYPKRGDLHVRATPSSKADFSRLAKHVMEEEPEAEWFFHHGKKMLIHGDRIAPTSKRTSYGLKSMIALVKKLYA